MVTTNEAIQTSVVASTAIPESLIYETLNGRPLYYKGYSDVIAGTLKLDDIMGSSDLQSVIVMILAGTLWNKIDRKAYLLTSNESGLHIDKNDNLSADIAIFDRKSVPKLKGKYFDVAPRIIVEVDIKIDLGEIGSDVAYISEKTNELFAFGVERVLWVLSKIRKVVILLPDQDWVITDWSNDVTVMDGCVLNIKHLLDEEGIDY